MQSQTSQPSWPLMTFSLVKPVLVLWIKVYLCSRSVCEKRASLLELEPNGLASTHYSSALVHGCDLTLPRNWQETNPPSSLYKFLLCPQKYLFLATFQKYSILLFSTPVTWHILLNDTIYGNKIKMEVLLKLIFRILRYAEAKDKASCMK